MVKPKRPRQWWDEGADLYADEPRTMQVHEPDDPDRDWSGLFDANGNKLMRERKPFGFRVKP